jgi:hypothetical protein
VAVPERPTGSNVSYPDAILPKALADILRYSVPVLFFILFFYVFEVQLLMQIIINRIALITEHRSTVRNLKWGTVVFITSINIAVFCIWIPAHTNPPTSATFVKINDVWDKISKVLILVVDAGLNWYFLRTVKIRLLKQHGLKKYAPLVGFNTKLMVVSIGMDAMLIGLMFLKNQVVYISFHPVTYLVKLNIEMSMASLVVRLAQGKGANDMDPEEFHSSSAPDSNVRSGVRASMQPKSIPLTSRSKRGTTGLRSPGLSKIDSDESLELGGIECRTDLHITHEDRTDSDRADFDRKDFIERKDFVEGSSRSSNDAPTPSVFDDDAPLHKNGLRIQERPM